MKTAAVLAATLAVASAFAPAPVNNRVGTELLAKAPEKTPFFNKVFGMDLFAPDPDVNTYGARAKKNLKTGSLGSNSYVPAGLSKAEYEKIRTNDQAKKNANYQKNVAKAGKYIDFTDWYKKRGTDISDNWIKGVTRGHNMVKTKYDFSGKDVSVNKKLDQAL